MESQIQLSSEFEGRELGGLTSLPWSPAGMPGMWLLSFLTCVSEGVSSPIPTTAPPLVLSAVSFNPLRFHEEERQRQLVSPAPGHRCPQQLAGLCPVPGRGSGAGALGVSWGSFSHPSHGSLGHEAVTLSTVKIRECSLKR